MFAFSRDPGTDGIGVAVTSAALDLSDARPSARDAAAARVARAIGAPVALVQQVHGADVVEVSAGDVAGAAGGLLDLTSHRADGLVTASAGVALTVRVADCVPVLLADAAAGVVGAVHAGRVGILAGAVAATVAGLHGLGAHRLAALVGPHVCRRCYEVPADMAAAFAAATGVAPATTTWGTPAIDLGAAVRRQLGDLGVADVVDVGGCTREDPRLHSARRDGAASGRLAALVWRHA